MPISSRHAESASGSVRILSIRTKPVFAECHILRKVISNYKHIHYIESRKYCQSFSEKSFRIAIRKTKYFHNLSPIICIDCFPVILRIKNLLFSGEKKSFAVRIMVKSWQIPERMLYSIHGGTSPNLTFHDVLSVPGICPVESEFWLFAIVQLKPWHGADRRKVSVLLRTARNAHWQEEKGWGMTDKNVPCRRRYGMSTAGKFLKIRHSARNF